MQKLYAYADETGQETAGGFFLVAVVILNDEREQGRELLKRTEYPSGKGKKKWTRATRKQRRLYIQTVIERPEFRGKLFYARFRNTTEYLSCVIQAIARALTMASSGQRYEATVWIDGLGKKEQHKVATGLRELHVRVKKVRGLRDELDEFIRLADAIAGFVRDSLEGQAYINLLHKDAVEGGVIQEV